MTETSTPARNAQFDAILKAEENVKANRILAELGMTFGDRNRGADALVPAKAKFEQLFGALFDESDPTDLRAFGEYRKARLDGRI